MSLPEDAQASPVKLFEGDGGELPLETRRALVQLLAGPSLDGQRHPKLWPVLVRDEALIRRRLSELFLDLVIDTDTQVAFTRQADAGDLETPVLLRRAQLTFLDSIMLLHLRQRLTQADAQGRTRGDLGRRDRRAHERFTSAARIPTGPDSTSASRRPSRRSRRTTSCKRSGPAKTAMRFRRR